MTRPRLRLRRLPLLLLLTAAARAAPPSGELASAPEPPPSAPSARTASCRACHETLRDLPPGPISPDLLPRDAGSFDAVIVGGGLPGLSAAWFLRKRKILLLDPAPVSGEPDARARLGGLPYTAAWTALREPDGKVRELLRALGLQPKRVSLLRNSMRRAGAFFPEWIAENPDALPYAPAVRPKIKALQSRLRDLIEYKDVALPLEGSNPEMLSQLDAFTFHQWLDNNFGAELAELGDAYALGLFGAGAREVSAAAGAFFLAGELGPAYTWEGGPGAAAEALAAELAPRISTGAFVWRVSQDPRGVQVDYHLGGQDWRAKARVAVLASPALATRRTAAGLSAAKREALAGVRYASRLAVPLRMRRVVQGDSFLVWTPGLPFEALHNPLSDAGTLHGATEQLLVAYAAQPGEEGLRRLLRSTDQELAAETAASLDAAFPGGAGAVAESAAVRLAHWPLPYPGYLSRVRPVVAASEGRFFFAGPEMQLPSFEGAVLSGWSAAQQAEGLLSRPEALPPAPR